ncbi:MAG: hypothetical protein RBT55_13585 [Rhodocyclaceae bacterium]|nr:hypothetical protein [Rhodocyclaceae bacterium]
MSEQNNANDPLEFVRGMWNNMGFNLPGMITPTLDVDELDKRITDMKAVESWLKMNLSMLQMSIQGLEMQRATLAAVRAMGQQHSENAQAAQSGEAQANPFANAAAMWPWAFMSPQGQDAPQDGSPPTPAAETPPPAKPKAPRKAGGDK